MAAPVALARTRTRGPVTARRLADATGIPSSSLARLLADADQTDPTTGQPRGLHPGGVVVLDEAGIVDTRRLCALFTHAALCRTALVLVGDPRQLPEIEAGGLFSRLAQDPSTLHLSDNRRQQDGWERDALARLRAGNIDPAIDAYTAHGRIHQSQDPEALRAALVSDYLNARARTENPYEVAILAVSRAVVTSIDSAASSLTLHTDDNCDVTVTAAWAARHDMSHAYAMTLHKAQGLTVDHAPLYGSEALTREAGYVGLSRGRRENHIYLSATTRMSERTCECDFDRM